MKILIVRMYPDVLNIDSYNCQEIGLAKALIRKGNICDIVLYTDKEKSYEKDIIFDKNKKIHIYYLKAKSFLKNAFYEKKIYDICKLYDVVQTAEYDQIANVRLKKYCKKMVIYHGPYESEFTKGYNIKCMISDFYYLFHKSYKNTPCISKSELATKFLKKKGFNDITTVGVGIDEDRFKNSSSNDIIKELIDRKAKEKLRYITYIGKIEERRNITFLIDLFEKVYNNNSNVRLLIIGNGNKDYVNEVFNYAKNIGVYDKIIHVESLPQDALLNVYKNSDTFLLPTRYEIFGMVLLEAMYFGVPVVTTLNGGSSTIIDNGKNGYVINSYNIKEWYKAIKTILDNKSNIGSLASEQIKNNYLWNKLCDNFIEIYKGK